MSASQSAVAGYDFFPNPRLNLFFFLPAVLAPDTDGVGSFFCTSFPALAAAICEEGCSPSMGPTATRPPCVKYVRGFPLFSADCMLRMLRSDGCRECMPLARPTFLSASLWPASLSGGVISACPSVSRSRQGGRARETYRDC